MSKAMIVECPECHETYENPLPSTTLTCGACLKATSLAIACKLVSSKWDKRFVELAKHFSTWSKDPSTQVGAVLARDKVLISAGFNGFPKGMSDDKALYANREEKYSRIVHAEINSLLFAERSVKDCTLYTWPFACCDRCAVQMLQAGIQRFVFPKLPAELQERWGVSVEKTKKFFDEVGAEWLEVEV